MIQYVRVDFRLVHGQVIHSWLKSTNSNTIFILDDDLMSEPYKMKMFKICVPPFVNLEMYSVDQGIQKLRKHKDDKNIAVWYYCEIYYHASRYAMLYI